MRRYTVVLAKLAQRSFVELVQDTAQFLIIATSESERRAIVPSQCPNQRVSMFAANFTVFVSVPIVEPLLCHSSLPQRDSFQRNSSKELAIAYYTFDLRIDVGQRLQSL